MRVFGITLGSMFLSHAMAAALTIIPNGGAGVGSLSVVNPSTGRVERSLLTAVSPTSAVSGIDFAITNTGESAAVVSFLQHDSTPGVYFLSLVSLTTGAITAQKELSFVPARSVVPIAANPKTSFLYFGYSDSSGNFHIQQLDAFTLHTLRDSNLGANGGSSIIVSPDGQSIYISGYPYNGVTALQASNLTLIGTVPLTYPWNVVVSPDSSTFYVAAGKYPDIALTAVNAATLQGTETISLSSLSVIFGLAISADGSQLYIPAQANFQGEAIYTLELATQNLMSVPAVVTGNIAAAPDGTVYVLCGSEVLVFDPASQSITARFSLFSSGSLALNSTGTVLYFLNSLSSDLALAGPPLSPILLPAAATGFLSSAAYDAKDNLLLVADDGDNIEVLDALIFQPAGSIFIPSLSGGAFLTTEGGSGFATSSGEVVRFDPVSLRVTGNVSLPYSQSAYLIQDSQPVIDGGILYVPFSISLNGGPNGNAAANSDAGRPANGIAVIDALQMKLTALWPFPGLPMLALAPSGHIAYAIVPPAAVKQPLNLDEIDLSTGQIVQQVKIPGQTISPYSNPAVSPDGKTIYFSDDNTLFAFDAQTLALTNSASVVSLVNLAVSPDGNYLYGATSSVCGNCPTSYSLQIISTSSLQVIAETPSVYQPGTAIFLDDFGSAPIGDFESGFFRILNVSEPLGFHAI